MRSHTSAVLPSTASLLNPVDLVGDADAARYSNALHALGGAADAALVVLTAQAATDAVGVARAVVGATRGWSVPVAAAFVGGARVLPGARVLEDAGIPCYAFPEPAVKTLAGMAVLAERRVRPSAPRRFHVSLEDGRGYVAELRAQGRTQLGMLELAPLLESYGIPCAGVRHATTAADGAAAARQLGFPVAIKVHSPDISHKTEVGGVRLGLRSEQEVAAATAEMLEHVRGQRPQSVITGVLVQRMVDHGKELLLGLVRDPQFGPLVMVGFGGVYVEILNDTAMRLTPLGLADAHEMLEELTMAPLLHGVRGEAPVDVAGLCDTVCRFAQLGTELPELMELEVNPLVASPRGVIAVDARARLSQGDAGGHSAEPGDE
jgi:acetyltransferase